MIQTVYSMATSRDRGALEELWALLGSEGPLKPAGRVRSDHADLIAHLIQSSCLPKGDIYAAERTALAEMAKTVGLEDAARYPTANALEDAIVDALEARMLEALERMSDKERERIARELMKRLSEEQRIQFIDRVLRDWEKLPREQQDAFLKELGAQLDLDESELTALRQGLAGGAAVLLPTLMARQAGFSVYLLSTKLLFVSASKAGLTLPFTVYMLKNRALGWLLGPIGMLVTTGLSAGWFAVKSWRRRERFRKLVQLVVYTTAWRREQGGREPSSIA
jgi:hypothetical protein